MFGMILFLTIAVSLILLVGLGALCFKLGRGTERTLTGVKATVSELQATSAMGLMASLGGLVAQILGQQSMHHRFNNSVVHEVEHSNETLKGLGSLDQKVEAVRSGGQSASSKINDRLDRIEQTLARLANNQDCK